MSSKSKKRLIEEDDVDSGEEVYSDGDGLERVDLFEGMKTSSSGKKEKKEIADFSKKILDVLKDLVEVKGEFAASGELKGAPLVPINIKGFGKIALPLYEEKTVAPLLEFFKKSPHGLKDKTIVNEAVRKSWELKENEFSIANPEWDKYMKSKVIPQVIKSMELEYTKIEAKLYKLLLYEPGSFFKPHRDSEKEDGMFGSLIIQLPSKYTGGELIIRHNGEEKAFDFGKDKNVEFSMYFSAFYCDLEHEVKPLKKGYRVSLVYNLISKGGEILKAPTSDTADAQMKKFSKLIKEWKFLSPKKFIYVLSHKYTMDGLSLAGLKSDDQSLGRFMKDVSDKTGLCVALGIWETQEFGAPFYADDGEGYPGHYSGSDVKMLKKLNYPLVEETYEVDFFVKNLITFDKVRISPKFKGNPKGKNEWGGGYSQMSIPDDAMKVDFNNEVLKKESFKNILADQVDYSGWTGNEGVQMTRWYNKAVLVFWPKNHPLGQIWTATGDPPKEIVQETKKTKAADASAEGPSANKKKKTEKTTPAKKQPKPRTKTQVRKGM